VVLIGSMFDGGPALIEPMRQTIHALALRARLVRLTAPPVIGAVLLGMQQAGLEHRSSIPAKAPRRPNHRPPTPTKPPAAAKGG